MKVKTIEVDAIVSELKNIQKAEREVQESNFVESLRADKRFLRLAIFIKNEMFDDFEFLIAAHIQKSVAATHVDDIKEQLIGHYKDEHWSPAGFKSERELQHEVILVANGSKPGTTFQDIIKLISPFKHK